MRQLPIPKDRIMATPAEQAVALELVTETDLLRLKAIARLHARGLPPDVGWEDLLQETFARVLAGSRRQPPGVPTVAFLSGVMRSLRAAHWGRRMALADPASPANREFRVAPADLAVRPLAASDPTPDPERALCALQEIAAIERLFADDPAILQIIEGLGEGLTAEEIRSASGLASIEYDTARRRMRRVLLREGLTCGNL